jgi:hypothetical protein
MINALFTAFALIAAGQGTPAGDGQRGSAAGLEQARAAAALPAQSRRLRQAKPGNPA